MRTRSWIPPSPRKNRQSRQSRQSLRHPLPPRSPRPPNPHLSRRKCRRKSRKTGPQALRDRRGEALPIERAFGCRSELFNARVLWLADKRADWQGLGARYARLSFLRESAAECAAVVRAYRTGEGAAPEEFTRGLYYKGVE